jgi:hypothetical protein
VTARKAPARRCTWPNRSQPAQARVRFALPNLLAGSQRDYCAAHAAQVCAAPGTRVVARVGPRRAEQPTLPGVDGGQPAPAGPRGRGARKEVVG